MRHAVAFTTGTMGDYDIAGGRKLAIPAADLLLTLELGLKMLADPPKKPDNPRTKICWGLGCESEKTAASLCG